MKYKPAATEEDLYKVINKLNAKVDELARNMEKMSLAEYIQMLERPRRLLYVNFLFGIARGFGAAIGFTLLAALVLYFMQKAIMLNIPVIGEFIADIVSIVQRQLSVGGY